MNVANKKDAKAGLRPVAPPDTTFFGTLLGDRQLTIAGHSARLIGAAGVITALLAVLSLVIGWRTPGVLLLLTGCVAVVSACLAATAAAQKQWERWWQVYLATHEGADVSSVIFDNPTPPWFTISEDHITLDFPPTSSAVVHAGTRQRVETALTQAWAQFLPSGTAVLLDWATPTRLEAHAADSSLLATQQALFRRDVAAALHAATGHDLAYTLPFIEVVIAFAKADQPIPVRVDATSTTATELCSEYQRPTCQQVLEPILTKHNPALRTYWTWTNLSVEVLVLHPSDPQAQAHTHQQALLKELQAAVGYANEGKVASVAISGWDHGPTVVSLLMDRSLTTAQVPSALSLHPRVLLARTYPDRAWLAPRVLETPMGVCVTYQAVPHDTPQGADASRQAAAESVLLTALPFGDHAWFEASTTDGHRSTSTFAVGTDRLLDEYWRDTTTTAVHAALPGGEVFFDLPTRRLAIRN